jgi:ribosomal protein S18 acetylase RimI-like enzyme
MRRLRTEPREGDREVVRDIVRSSGFFSPDEIAIAVELVDEALVRGEASGYRFVFLEDGSEAIGYACFGPVPATEGSWDLYWIAVHASARRAGHGRWLMQEAERCIAACGGRRVWIDTSSRAQYAPTRAFYERCGYTRAALLEDFYRPGDGKVIYCRTL